MIWLLGSLFVIICLLLIFMVVITPSNEGGMAAEETVFLFTHDKVASVAPPLLVLKGFARIALAPGQRGTVRFDLPAAELKFLGFDLEPVFEPGTIEVLVGPSADRDRLRAVSIELVAG